jgi:glyoxylase-like metal-dependent hydrolase (beta-lactamase superfamily II)
MKKVLLIVALLVVFAVGSAGFYVWQTYQKFMKVETIQYDPQLTVYLGGGNSIVLTSEDGASALIVDTKMRNAAEILRNQVKAKDVTIVNTHAHLDHTGGNSLYPQAKIIAGGYTQKQWDDDSSKSSRYPDITLRPGEERVLKIGSETVHVFNIGRAHTWNDVVVYCKNRKLLVAGDLVFHQMHPAVIAKSGTNVGLWINVLETLSKKNQIKTLVPGHGDVTDQNALLAMKNYFISVGDSIGDKGKQAILKEKYKNYVAFPGMFSFNNTLQFIEQERNEAR